MASRLLQHRKGNSAKEQSNGTVISYRQSQDASKSAWWFRPSRRNRSFEWSSAQDYDRWRSSHAAQARLSPAVKIHAGRRMRADKRVIVLLSRRFTFNCASHQVRSPAIATLSVSNRVFRSFATHFTGLMKSHHSSARHSCKLTSVQVIR